MDTITPLLYDILALFKQYKEYNEAVEIFNKYHNIYVKLFYWEELAKGK